MFEKEINVWEPSLRQLITFHLLFQIECNTFSNLNLTTNSNGYMKYLF